MCELVQTLHIITKDRISSLRLFRVKTEPKPSCLNVTENCVMRAQKIRFLRFELQILAVENLLDSVINLHFEFGFVPS